MRGLLNYVPGLNDLQITSTSTGTLYLGGASQVLITDSAEYLGYRWGSLPDSKSVCHSCRGETLDDVVGNCAACGAPRGHHG
jgi:hypothetical protein